MSLGWSILIIVFGGVAAIATWVIVDGASRLERVELERARRERDR